MKGTVSWRILLYALLIFLAGLFIGGIACSTLAKHLLVRPPNAAEMSHHYLKHLQSALSLTPGQSEKIKPLLEQWSTDMGAIWVSTHQQVSARIEETESRIAEFLTPEQKAKFAKLQDNRRKKMEHILLPLPPPR